MSHGIIATLVMVGFLGGMGTGMALIIELEAWRLQAAIQRNARLETINQMVKDA